MAINIPLMILSRVVLSVVGKLVVGVTVAGLTYSFLIILFSLSYIALSLPFFLNYLRFLLLVAQLVSLLLI